MYNSDALKKGIDACKKNIQTFEEAIERERETIRSYYDMIETLERKEREAKLKKTFANNNVEELEDDSKK